MVRRRGQAAVEFLTTYSWAIFILFGVVSAIYMLDLADPDRYADPECVLDNQISCLEAQYQMGSGSDQLRLNLRNNYPQAVRVTDIRVELDTGTISSSGPLGGGSGVTIEPGSEQIITHTVQSPAWSDEGYVTEEVAATLDFRIDFEPVSSGNSYQKSGYTIVRAVPTS
jgi:hypothetical protein